jgi:hypothetical protein
MSFATKLRISPQSRVNPLALTRSHLKQDRSYYETMRDDDDDESA